MPCPAATFLALCPSSTSSTSKRLKFSSACRQAHAHLRSQSCTRANTIPLLPPNTCTSLRVCGLRPTSTVNKPAQKQSGPSPPQTRPHKSKVPHPHLTRIGVHPWAHVPTPHTRRGGGPTQGEPVRLLLC